MLQTGGRRGDGKKRSADPYRRRRRLHGQWPHGSTATTFVSAKMVGGRYAAAAAAAVAPLLVRFPGRDGGGNGGVSTENDVNSCSAAQCRRRTRRRESAVHRERPADAAHAYTDERARYPGQPSVIDRDPCPSVGSTEPLRGGEGDSTLPRLRKRYNKMSDRRCRQARTAFVGFPGGKRF